MNELVQGRDSRVCTGAVDASEEGQGRHDGVFLVCSPTLRLRQHLLSLESGWWVEGTDSLLILSDLGVQEDTEIIGSNGMELSSCHFWTEKSLPAVGSVDRSRLTGRKLVRSLPFSGLEMCTCSILGRPTAKDGAGF